MLKVFDHVLFILQEIIIIIICNCNLNYCDLIASEFFSFF